ncbi:MAG TPA: hypothetical protein VES42_17930 [Pilimelia sp.]|nr:hypothetical protein [Pilimelia sp.]
MHRRRSLAVRLLPAVAVLLTLTAVVVRPALAAGRGDVGGRPATTQSAGSASTTAPPAPFWPYRKICTEGAITAGTVTAGAEVATTSVRGWIRPCEGETTDGARYGIAFSDGRWRWAVYRSYDSLTGTTEFEVTQLSEVSLSAGAVVSVCIVDHGRGDTEQPLVRLVTCAGLKIRADGTTAIVQVSVAPDTYRLVRSVRTRERPGGDGGLCPACV